MEKLKLALLVFFSMAFGGVVVGGVDHLVNDNGKTTVIERSAAASTGGSGGASNVAAASASDVSALYTRVRPSVVEINAASSHSTSGSLGSGLVIDKDGHILTNNHVVSGFDQFDVSFADGTDVSADLVDTDPGNDIALLHVNLPADKLQPASLGDSSKVQQGEGVIAIGNPFGIEGSVTQGIVSGIGRTLGGGTGRPLRQLIQSDAAINKGNSGGGLFDLQGNVIGITSAIESPSGDGVFVGIGYAVPIDTAKRFLPDLLAAKTIEHPRLGITMEDLTPALAKSLNLSVQQGVLITDVDPASAAGKAGLKGGAGGRSGVGDVVTQVDGQQIKKFDDLAGYVDNKNVGDQVTITYTRDGKQSTAQIKLEAWKSTDAG